MNPASPPVSLPGCKSLTQRGLLLAATADGESVLRGCNEGEDAFSLRTCLGLLGVKIRQKGDSTRIVGRAGALAGTGVVLDVQEGGSTLRFLLAQVAAGGGEALFCGSPRLMERPHGGLLDCLTRMGATIESVLDAGQPALKMRSPGIPGGAFSLEDSASSQYISALMLVPWKERTLIHSSTGKSSRGYIDLTREAVARFRGPESLSSLANGWLASPGCGEAQDWTIPGDASAGTFFLAALLVGGGRLSFAVPPAPFHPESRLARDLAGLGFLAVDDEAIAAADPLPDSPLELDLDSFPDAAPALAVACVFLPGGGRLTGTHRLKDKESDRLKGMNLLVESMGGSASLDEETFVIQGPPAAQSVACLDPQGDHRMAMAAGIGQLGISGLDISDRDCVAKSFPGFWDTLSRWRDG